MTEVIIKKANRKNIIVAGDLTSGQWFSYDVGEKFICITTTRKGDAGWNLVYVGAYPFEPTGWIEDTFRVTPLDRVTIEVA